MPTIWDMEPKLLNHSVQRNREQFSRPSESYPNWFWLAAESGHFWFRIGNGGKRLEGECHPGEWLLCPPHEVLHRRTLSRLTFHVAHLEFETGPQLTGKTAPRDLHRSLMNMAALGVAPHSAEALPWKQHLLMDCLRSALWDQQSHTPFRRTDAQMEQLAAWLDAHLDQKLSFADIAQGCRLSPVALTRRFRAALGMAPSEYVLTRRLERARTLLLDTDESLDRIATRCGLGTGFYLSRQWSKRYGGSPARFRRENRI